MKKVLVFLLVLVSLSAVAEDRWELSGSGNDVELRQKYNYDPSDKFRGSIDSSGDVSLRNYNGDRLRGNLDSDGNGYLRNNDGDRIRVRSR
jgi:hypothetical protein